MIKGADVSTVSQNELFGGKYFDHKIEKDCLTILKEKGVNLFRLRLFVDPYDEKGNSYGAGICDLNDIITMAKRAKKLNVAWYLDIHYSDCWADPGKQTMPKAWVDLNVEQLANQVYDYTKNVLMALKNNNVAPSIISVGNEITNGMLWPIGKSDHFDNLVKLINAGIRACNEVLPQSKTMIHLDNGGRNDLYRHFFDNYFELGGLNFDYIGLSFYPMWHGTLLDLKNNMFDIKERYHKELIVVETSYPFTKADYKEYEGLADNQRKGMAMKQEMFDKLPYEISKQGQCDFIKALEKACKETGCLGYVYWGGECIVVKGVSWANDNAIEYMHEKGPGGNEWANQALFDYQGNALPVLDLFK